MTKLKRTSARPPSTGAHIKQGIVLFAALLGILWILEAVDVYLLRHALDQYGIRPRNEDGLLGILAAPFLHGNFEHLSANSVPLLIFGFLIYLRGLGSFVLTSLVIAVLSGLGVWLIGSPYSIHIGASGVIFGYFGFLLALGFYERSFSSIALSLVIAILYGGTIFGVLPGQPGISWEGHLCGFLAGIVAARLVVRRQARALRAS